MVLTVTGAVGMAEVAQEKTKEFEGDTEGIIREVGRNPVIWFYVHMS